MKALADSQKERTRGTKEVIDVIFTLMAFQLLDHYDIKPYEVAQCFSGVMNWADSIATNKLKFAEIKDTLKEEYHLTRKQNSHGVEIKYLLKGDEE